MHVMALFPTPPDPTTASLYSSIRIVSFLAFNSVAEVFFFEGELDKGCCLGMNERLELLYTGVLMIRLIFFFLLL